ncbi:MAG: hypothetical protein WBB45_15855 [Cyclobacteriaceae bacterium]
MIHPKIFRWLCIPLLLLAWFNPLKDTTLQILEDEAAKALESLAVLEGIYIMAESAASSRIPLVSGTFEGAATTLQEAISYLSMANVAIAANLLLTKMVHTKVIVISFVLLWLGTFWKKHQAMFLKVLIIGFLLNPGLDIYAHTLNTLNREAKFDSQETLHSQLQLMHKDYAQKEDMRQKEVQDRKEKQLQKNAAQGKDHLTFGQKVEDAVVNTATSGVQELEEDYRLTRTSVKFIAKQSLELVLNAFTSILFMYVLLPIGYLWLAYNFAGYWFTHTVIATAATPDKTTTTA